MDYRDRLLQEKLQLEEKIEKLEFMVDHPIPEITKRQFELMEIQLSAMNTYCRILEIRLKEE